MPYDSVELIYNHLKLSGGIGITIKKSFYLTGRGYLFMGGYNSGDFGLKGSVNQYLGNVHKNYGELVFGVELISKMPWWFYQQWNSNRFRWKNRFDKENYLILSGKYAYKNINAGVTFTTVGNYTYLNDSVKPAQIDNAETVLQIFAGGQIPVGKFGIDTRLVYQSTSRPNIIRLPTFSGTLNVFFRSPVFKKAATVQIGVQMRYFSNFYANAYMPELRAFYLQNEVSVGNFLWADVYLTLKVKRARLFVKMANATGYFEGYSYWVAPHYPDRDARFDMGISWRFHD